MLSTKTRTVLISFQVVFFEYSLFKVMTSRVNSRRGIYRCENYERKDFSSAIVFLVPIACRTNFDIILFRRFVGNCERNVIESLRQLLLTHNWRKKFASDGLSKAQGSMLIPHKGSDFAIGEMSRENLHCSTRRTKRHFCTWWLGNWKSSRELGWKIQLLSDHL